MMLAEASETDWMLVGTSTAVFVLALGAAFLGFRPVAEFIRNRESEYDRVLRGQMLLEVAPRSVTILTLVLMIVIGVMVFIASGSGFFTAIGVTLAVFIPNWAVNYLRQRRLRRLEDQLVAGVQTLTAGVRAGLNLVQAMQMLTRDAAAPIRQEFAHLLREYEYGIPLEEAMDAAAARINSNDYRLLFSALQTHRERGGNLGETLDRIAASIREIQRLEKRVEALTAQGRTTARWLSAFPSVVMLIMYTMFDKPGVTLLFTDDVGKLILVVVAVLNVIAYLWIKKIINIDI